MAASIAQSINKTYSAEKNVGQERGEIPWTTAADPQFCRVRLQEQNQLPRTGSSVMGLVVAMHTPEIAAIYLPESWLGYISMLMSLESPPSTDGTSLDSVRYNY